MKSKILFIAFSLMSWFSSARDIKVKKEEIQVDGKSIAKISYEKRIYTISDLSGKPLFTATITDQTPLKNTAIRSWIQLTGTNGVIRKMDFLANKGLFSLGYEKPIVMNITYGSTTFIAIYGDR